MKSPFKIWLQRYLVAELLGTVLACIVAAVAYRQTHSYLAAAGAGFVAEGLGFYGYIVSHELLANGRAYRLVPLRRRLGKILGSSSGNLIVQFAPAEIVDSVLVRPGLMIYVPQHIEPYILGFLTAKLLADGLFYTIAVAGFWLQQRLRRA